MMPVMLLLVASTSTCHQMKYTEREKETERERERVREREQDVSLCNKPKWQQLPPIYYYNIIKYTPSMPAYFIVDI